MTDIGWTTYEGADYRIVVWDARDGEPETINLHVREGTVVFVNGWKVYYGAVETLPPFRCSPNCPVDHS